MSERVTTVDDRVRLVRSHVCKDAVGYTWQGRSVAFRVEQYLSDGLAGAGKSDGRVRAPMVGRIIAVEAAPGQFVAAGDRLAIMESMKMEIQIVAAVGGRVSEVACSPDAMVERDQVLFAVTPDGAAGP